MTARQFYGLKKRTNAGILTFMMILAVTLLFGQAMYAKETIVVNTSGIDARTDLTDQQKQDLKDAIVKEIKDNFESALGEGNVDVTTDTSQSGDRTVNISNTFASPKGSAWGSWPHGSDTCTVYLKEFMDDPAVNGSFQDADGNPDPAKLGNAVGHTASHELGHSYSVGHNDNTGDDVNKMTNGENVDADTRATNEWHFDDHAKDTIEKNQDKKPCATAPDYAMLALITDFDYFDFPWQYKPCDLGAVDTWFSFNGRLAPMFEFGWFGEDTDEGLIDGNPNFDFIKKSTMTGGITDAEMITFFEQSHQAARFVLRGIQDGPWEGELFPLDPDQLMLSEFIGENAQFVTMNWDIDYDGIFDVTVMLDARDERNGDNGFRYEMPTVVQVTETEGFNLVYEEGESSDTYFLELGVETFAPVHVTIFPGSEDIGINGAPAGEPVVVTFEPGEWMTPQEVTVTAFDDGEPEGNESVLLHHMVMSPDPVYDGLVLPDYSVLVYDSPVAVEPMPIPVSPATGKEK